jgi:hypothetical protein
MSRRALDAESIRDSVLHVSGRLDRRMYGPAFRDFVIERPEHSPHYEYHRHDPGDPASHRRSVYRFLVRSQPQPFMQNLDCADPSQSVAKRDTTLTATQALTLLNNKFIIYMSQQFAARLQESAADLPSQTREAFELALARPPEPAEHHALIQYAQEHGLVNLCRFLFNLNEFVFVD